MSDKSPTTKTIEEHVWLYLSSIHALSCYEDEWVELYGNLTDGNMHTVHYQGLRKSIPILREELLEMCAKIHSGNDSLGYVGCTEFWITEGPNPGIATRQTFVGDNIKDNENRQFHTEQSGSDMEAAWKFWNQILKEKK